MALIEEIEALGGARWAVETGYYQEAIAQAAYEFQKAQEDGRIVVVGVNRFTTDEVMPVMVNPNFAALEAGQQAAVAEARRRRDATAVLGALGRLEAAAATPEPLMPRILDAVRTRATLGEISDVLRRVWGVYHA